jgi:hypothetical protein
MHWTKHYKPVKDCQFPFQAYVEEDWIADHQKTEISIKKGDIIVVYGECEPDGHNAADVPRTSKRINGIMDVKYPVFDKESTNYWIGSVQNATGASDYYAKHKVGHFPISKVVPLDIHLWEVEVARKKRVEERQRRRNAENAEDDDDDDDDDDGDDDDDDDDDDDEEDDDDDDDDDDDVDDDDDDDDEEEQEPGSKIDDGARKKKDARGQNSAGAAKSANPSGANESDKESEGDSSKRFKITFGSGKLGFGIETLEHMAYGNVVMEIVAGASASKNGLEVGDLLVGVGEKDVSKLDFEATYDIILSLPRPVDLYFIRPGKDKPVVVMPEDRDKVQTNEQEEQTATVPKEEVVTAPQAYVKNKKPPKSPPKFPPTVRRHWQKGESYDAGDFLFLQSEETGKNVKYICQNDISNAQKNPAADPSNWYEVEEVSAEDTKLAQSEFSVALGTDAEKEAFKEDQKKIEETKQQYREEDDQRRKQLNHQKTGEKPHYLQETAASKQEREAALEHNPQRKREQKAAEEEAAEKKKDGNHHHHHHHHNAGETPHYLQETAASKREQEAALKHNPQREGERKAAEEEAAKKRRDEREAKRKRKAAEDAERNRKAAEAAERKRKAAEEAAVAAEKKKKRQKGGFFGQLSWNKTVGSRWKRKSMARKQREEELQKRQEERLTRVDKASTTKKTAAVLLQEILEEGGITSGASKLIKEKIEIANDDPERAGILRLAIESYGKNLKQIKKALEDLEVAVVIRLADAKEAVLKSGVRTPTPVEDSDVDAYDEESDDEHPEMDGIRDILNTSMNRYAPRKKPEVDRTSRKYVDPEWLCTNDDDFSDSDPFDDMDNNADPEFRELAMEDVVAKYQKGLETMHKAYSQMPGNDTAAHNQGINKTFESLKNSKERLGWASFLRLCKDFNLITRENKTLRNSRDGTGYNDIAIITHIAAGKNGVISREGKLPVLRSEAKAIFKRVAGKKSQYNYVNQRQLMEAIFGIVLKAWPRLCASQENHQRELWSSTSLKAFRNVVRNPHKFRPQFRVLKCNGPVHSMLQRIRTMKRRASRSGFVSNDFIIAEVITNYQATPEELNAFEGDPEDAMLFETLKKGDQLRILALQNTDIDDDEEVSEDFKEWLPIPKGSNFPFGVKKGFGNYWLAQQLTVDGTEVDDEYAHFEHRGILPAEIVKIVAVTKEKELTKDLAAKQIQKVARGAMLRLRRQRLWDSATTIASMARGQQQRKRYSRAARARRLQASYVIERLLNKQPDFPKLYTALDRLNISDKKQAIDSTIAKSRGFVFAQGNFKDKTPGNLGKREDVNEIFTKDHQHTRRSPPKYTGQFAKGKPDRVREDIPVHDPLMDSVQDLFEYGLQMLFKAYCATFGMKKLDPNPTFQNMEKFHNTINLQGFAQLCADFKLITPTFKGSKMCSLFLDQNKDYRFTHEGYMNFNRKKLKATYQRWCVFHQDPKDTHTAIRDWRNLADILAELAWESYTSLSTGEDNLKGATRPEVAAAMYTRMSLAEDDLKQLFNILMGFCRGMTFADGKHPGLEEKYVYQMMKYATKGATHPVDRMRIALHERKSRGMDIRALFTNLDAQSYGWEHPSGILKPESLWKALGIILEHGLISAVEWNLQILPFLLERFGGKENARASGLYEASDGVDYVKFSEWINEPLPDFHTAGHGHMLSQKRHRHRLQYHQRAKMDSVRRNEYGDVVGALTESEIKAMERKERIKARREITPPVVFDEEEDIIGQTYGKYSGFHDHWNSDKLHDYSSGGFPAVGNEQNTPGMDDSAEAQNERVPSPPQRSNSAANRNVSPLQKRYLREK